jgi:hypothetical protein
MQKYEKGSNRISGSKLLKICTALKCHPNSLLGWNGPTPADAVDGTLELANKFAQLTDKQRSAMRALIAAIKVLDDRGQIQPRRLRSEVPETWAPPCLRCPEPTSATGGAEATAGPSH